MGTMTLATAAHLAAKTAPPTSGSPLTLIFLVVGFGLVYLLFMRPQANRRKKMMQQQQQVMPGTRVRTTAGMYGTIVSGDDRDIVLEVAPGVHITMLRRAIMDVVPDEAPDDMPHHEDLPADSAEVPEPERDETPAEDQDRKDGK